jgi:hypothetical protein
VSRRRLLRASENVSTAAGELRLHLLLTPLFVDNLPHHPTFLYAQDHRVHCTAARRMQRRESCSGHEDPFLPIRQREQRQHRISPRNAVQSLVAHVRWQRSSLLRRDLRCPLHSPTHACPFAMNMNEHETAFAVLATAALAEDFGWGGRWSSPTVSYRERAFAYVSSCLCTETP